MTGCSCLEVLKELDCRCEPEAAIPRMEPSIDGSRADGDDHDFVPPVGEDAARLAARTFLELDVRAMEGEGKEGEIGVDEWVSSWIYSSSFRLRVREGVGVEGMANACEGSIFPFCV